MYVHITYSDHIYVVLGDHLATTNIKLCKIWILFYHFFLVFLSKICEITLKCSMLHFRKFVKLLIDGFDDTAFN